MEPVPPTMVEQIALHDSVLQITYGLDTLRLNATRRRSAAERWLPFSLTTAQNEAE